MVHEGVQEAERRGLVHGPSEDVRAERERGDLDARGAERPALHRGRGAARAPDGRSMMESFRIIREMLR